MKIKITVMAALLLCTVISCSRNRKMENLKSADLVNKEEKKLSSIIEDEKNGFRTDTVTGPPAPPDITQGKKDPVASGALPKPDWDKKIIKTADLDFEVKDYKAYYSSLREQVKNLGGYLAQEEQQQNDYKIENTLVIKVPVDQFDNAVNQLSEKAERINIRKVSSQDVTAEYVDIRSRIESKKQVRQRYMDLLKQARNMEEILNVQSEINGIQEDIESATGRIGFLGHSSSYSTINLSYYQVLNPSAKAGDSPGFGTKLSSAFQSGWNWIKELFIVFVSIWPLLFVIFIVVILYKRARPKKVKEA